jgi:hypothetical protein
MFWVAYCQLEINLMHKISKIREVIKSLLKKSEKSRCISYSLALFFSCRRNIRMVLVVAPARTPKKETTP